MLDNRHKVVYPTLRTLRKALRYVGTYLTLVSKYLLRLTYVTLRLTFGILYFTVALPIAVVRFALIRALIRKDDKQE